MQVHLHTMKRLMRGIGRKTPTLQPSGLKWRLLALCFCLRQEQGWQNPDMEMKVITGHPRKDMIMDIWSRHPRLISVGTM